MLSDQVAINSSHFVPICVKRFISVDMRQAEFFGLSQAATRAQPSAKGEGYSQSKLCLGRVEGSRSTPFTPAGPT